jgi:hypothetical protein
VKKKPAKRDRRIKTSVYVSPQQLSDLKEISEKTQIPIATLIRNGINHVISQHK